MTLLNVTEGYAATSSCTLKVEAACSSEMSIKTCQTTRYHISENSNLCNHFIMFMFSYSVGGVRLSPLIVQFANVHIIATLGDG
jgi:hypothetical protein